MSAAHPGMGLAGTDRTRSTEASFTQEAARRALRVAWLAVGLGIALQLLVLVTRLASDADFLPAAFGASLFQGISWSVLVCSGVAVGTVANRFRAVVTGIVGLLTGPAAWGTAKGVQRTVQSLMGADAAQVTDTFLALTALKGVEYALLGAALGILVDRRAGLRAYIGLGSAVGLLFTALSVPFAAASADAQGTPMSGADVVGMATNELVFPIGCAVILHVVLRMRGHLDLGRAVEPESGTVAGDEKGSEESASAGPSEEPERARR